MIVMKFGGAALQDAASVENAVRILKDRISAGPLVVVSAMGKTTRGLLAAARTAASGDPDRAVEDLERIRRGHEVITSGLFPGPAPESLASRMGVYFDELRHLLNGVAILAELSPLIHDRILSYGELMSSAIVSECLKARGVSSALLDARKLIATDDRFTAARPMREVSDPRLRDAVLPLVRSGTVPVLQGYIGATRSGATTTLGFEGSDLSATLCGAALAADEIQIWKEVAGLMTADPDVVPGARTVATLSYAEAGELTHYGAKVLHPDAVEPARRARIPIRILDTRAPGAPGTRIADGPVNRTGSVRSIAYKKPVCLYRVLSNGGAWNRRINDLLRSLDGLGQFPLFTSFSGSRLTLVAASPADPDPLTENLAFFGDVESLTGLSTVTLVGEGLASDHGAVWDAFRATDGLSGEALMFGLSPINCTLIVDSDSSPDVIRRLHSHFFGAS
jgi:aspartate kinase